MCKRERERERERESTSGLKNGNDRRTAPGLQPAIITLLHTYKVSKQFTKALVSNRLVELYMLKSMNSSVIKNDVDIAK